jgi:hypothetical protein
MEIPSKRLKGIKGKNFEAEIEYNSNLVAIHLPSIKVFNRQTLMEMKELLVEWDEFFKTVGYEDTHAAFFVSDEKTKKLVKMLGFEYITENLGFSIYKYIGE